MSSWDKHPSKITLLALPLSLLQEKEAKEIKVCRASRDKMSAAHCMFPFTKYCPEFIAVTCYISRAERSRAQLSYPAHMAHIWERGRVALALKRKRETNPHSLSMIEISREFHSNDFILRGGMVVVYFLFLSCGYVGSG